MASETETESGAKAEGAKTPSAGEPEAKPADASKPVERVSPAKQVLSKKKAEAEAAAEQQRDGEPPPKTAQQLFQENLPAIVVVGLLLAVVLVWWSYDQTGRRERSDRAWAGLAKLKRDQLTGDAGFADLAKEQQGTTADPYIQIAWAARLYESGERDKVEQARDVLKRVLQENADVPLLQRLVQTQLEKINAELSDPTVPWKAKAETPSDAAPSAPAAPSEPTAPAEDHGHGDHTGEAPVDDDHGPDPGDEPAEEPVEEPAEAPPAEAPAAGDE